MLASPSKTKIVTEHGLKIIITVRRISGVRRFALPVDDIDRADIAFYRWMKSGSARLLRTSSTPVTSIGSLFAEMR